VKTLDNRGFLEKLDLKFLSILILFCALAFLGAFCGQPLIHGNEQAQNIIITVFSILAGFLIAIITFLGDQPAIHAKDSWRKLEGRRPEIVKQLAKHKFLFWLYMTALALIFLTVLLKPSKPPPPIGNIKQASISLASSAIILPAPASHSNKVSVASESLTQVSVSRTNGCRWVIFMEYLYLFLSVFAFLWSICLPQTLMTLQVEKLDKAIEERRAETTNPDSPTA